MIVIGYQGIGKSTVARESKGFIDLESSNFYHEGERPKDWHIYYCQIAEHLSAQGYVVFVSSHEPIRHWFRQKRAVIICPTLEIRKEWIQKLEDRYFKTMREKDFRAWKNAVYRYDENIKELYMCGIPVLPIRAMFYDLEQMIRAYIKSHSDIDLHCRQIMGEENND